MADVTYNTASFPSLVRTVVDLRTSNARALVLMAYKQRDESERDLWVMLESNGLRLQQVAAEGGSGGVQVEIWMAIP